MYPFTQHSYVPKKTLLLFDAHSICHRLRHYIEGIVEANNEVGGEILYTSIFILSSATDWNVVQGCKVYDSTSS